MAERLHLRTELENKPVSRFPEQLARLGANWGWVFAAGIAYIVLGLLALSWPVGSTVSITFALGALLLVGGIAQLIQCIRLWKEAGDGWRIVQAIFAFAAGLLMLRYPAAGMAGIAITLSFYFFVSAAVKGIIAFGMRPHKGWGWALTSAIASFFLGSYVVATFPISALWLPGLLLGVDFVVHGASSIGMSLNLRRFHQRAKESAQKAGEVRPAA